MIETATSTIVVTSADSIGGLAGYIIDRATDTQLEFEARAANGAAYAVIRNRAGTVVYRYDERTETVRTATSSSGAGLVRPDGQPLTMTGPPTLEIAGESYQPALPGGMRVFATTIEGHLLEDLAMHVIEAAPQTTLSDDRRALEIGYQALQTELPAATMTTRNADYYSGPDGFLVRSQPASLLLSHNILHALPAGTTAAGEVAYDGAGDASASNGDCIGRCGGGCGTWYGSWVGDPTITAGGPYCPVGYDGPSETVYSYSGIMHYTTGPQCSSDACALHDECSSNWFAELTYCNALLPDVFLHWCDYQLTWTFDEYTAIGEVGGPVSDDCTQSEQATCCGATFCDRWDSDTPFCAYKNQL